MKRAWILSLILTLTMGMQTTMANTMTLAEQNEQAGDTFLATNKKAEGVIALPNGMQYKILTPGTGAKPVLTDTVTVNYEGKLINGHVFDSSYQRGQAISFPLNGVIEGWQQGLQLMKTGATWELYIPANLAYGERGAPGAIGPNETLIFKVNLISIKN